MQIRAACFSLLVLTVFAAPAGIGQPVKGLLPGEELTLTARSPQHIAGSFQHAGVTIRFDATRSETAVMLALLNRAGQPFYRAGSDLKTYTLEFLGDKARAKGTIAPAGKENAPQPQPQVEGSAATIRGFPALPEYKALPFLSRALAANDITGPAYPASLYLHALALSSAQVNKIVVPEVVLRAPAVAKPKCPDQRGDPCRNDCYGMCGPGCTCWPWVCGDCCMHTGCLTHDETCRLCDCGFLKHPGDCVLCYTATSFLGPHPCTVINGCQTPPKC